MAFHCQGLGLLRICASWLKFFACACWGALDTANGKAEGALMDLIGREAFSTARIPILGLSGVYDNS